MSRKLSTRPGPLSRLVTLVAACAIFLTGCEFSVYKLPLPGGADLGDNPYSVRVQFRDVLDLVPQSAVKVNDVSVGRVDEIELKGYTADVTLLLNDSVSLPDNTFARIRQTSLLGEKFVSLEAPAQTRGDLAEGDVIPLERSGRNPEVEEVLGAMSLLLNGGGVAQLNTITVELNKALEGRESDVKSVLTQLDRFTAELDKGKADIVDAIENLNKLAITFNQEDEGIKLALDELPAGLASIDRQRDDLIRMLEALNELSNVAVRVIRQSKAGTIDSLRYLDPILTKLADAGDALPKAFQLFLTYPFVDQVVGQNAVQARNLHMGDYTNLSVQMDVDLSNLDFETEVELICNTIGTEIQTIRKELENGGFPDTVINPILDELEQKVIDACTGVAGDIPTLDELEQLVCIRLPVLPGPSLPTDPTRPDFCDPEGSGNGDGGVVGVPNGPNVPDVSNIRPRRDRNNGGGGGGGGLPDLPGALNRAAPGTGAGTSSSADAADEPEFDSDLGAMLSWGMIAR